MEETRHSMSANSSTGEYIFKGIYAQALLIIFISMLAMTSSNACTTPTSTFPITEDFEANAFANWTHDPSNDFDWITHTGATGSGNTGPSSAYGGSYYAYTEATSPNNPDKVANLISPCFTVQVDYTTHLSFAYHMYGSGMGDFNVDISTNDGTSWTNLWALSGNQGNSWNTHSISLAGYEGQAVKLRFNVITGNYQSDVSIDDVVISSVSNIEFCNNGIDDDGDGLVDNADPDCVGCSNGTASVRVSTGTDDAEEDLSSGSVDLASSDLELAEDGSSVQLVGMRFNGMNIPEGALITNAYVEFETDVARSGATSLTIEGQDSDNPGTFTNNNSDLSNIATRPKTGASIPWVPAAWNTVNEKHQSPNIKLIIQEIIDRPGWTSGNSMAIFIHGSGNRESESYNGEAAAAPLLVIDYQVCLTEICDNEIDDDGDGSVDEVAVTNPYPGFPIDFLNNNAGWIDYDLGNDLAFEDNGGGSMIISGTIDSGTPVDFGAGANGSSCGATDGWDITLTLTDKMNWTEWQAAGGSANLNGSCSGSESDLDYWDVTGTLIGTGCNTGRTLTINGPKSPYRFQIGNGGNSGDNTCAFGMSTWFDIVEGGTMLNADIYAFIDETCYDETTECLDCDNTWIEAECAEIGNNWNIVSDVTASNGSYVTIKPGNSSTGTPPSSVDDRIRFNVTVSTAGDYNIFGRVQAPTSDDDSFWVRANGGTWYKWNSLNQFAPSSWEWGQVHDSDNGNALVSFALSAGLNTIDFAYREDGALLDKVMIGMTSDVPTGEGETADACIEICDNGIDDDGDGLIDCEDPDCTSNSTCVQCNLLANTEFNDGTNGWISSNTSPATSILSIDNTGQLSGDNSAFIDIVNSTGTDWNVQFRTTNGIPTNTAKTYNISFEAKATANKVIDLSVQQGGSPYTTYYASSSITITTTKQTYSIPNISFNTTANDGIFKIHLGSDANGIWIDNVILEEVNCSTIGSCATCVGDNLFDNPGFESGSYNGADVFITGVNSDDLGTNWGTPAGLDGWSHGPLYWVETNKATEGNKVVYLNNASGAAVCQGQYYDLGDGIGQISTCSDYRLCFDWASFNRDFPTGRSSESRPALDLTWFDINGSEISVSHQDLGIPDANQNWSNLTWTNVSHEFSLTGSLVPPANATSVRVNISESGSYDNGILVDNTSLCVTSPCFGEVDPEKCYFISDGQASGSDTQDTLYTFNYVTSNVTPIGATGTYRIESMAMDTITRKVYAATSDSFGIIDISTGLFYTISADMGSLNGADGVININDADGMTFDHANNVIWATERRALSEESDGAPNDLLFKIDPISGLVIQDAFGSGIGYLVIDTPENDLDDIAISDDGTLYAISNFGASGNQSFGIIDKVTGAWTDKGDYGIEDVESLAFTATGQLIATTGKDGDQKDQLYTIDAGTGIATYVGSILPGHDVEACDCISASLINLQIGDKVWADLNINGVQDIDEPGISGIVVNLLTGSGSPYLNDLGAATTTTTDDFGNYLFDGLPEGQYMVEFILPGGGTIFTFRNVGGNDEIDSDANTSTGRSHVITLANSTNDLSIDAGIKYSNVTVRDCNDSGELFVIDDSGVIKRFDQNTGALIGDFIKGLVGPIEMVVGSDDWLYVSNSDADEVRKYSLVTGVLVETISDKFDDPHGLTVGPDDNIYVNNDNLDEVIKIDIATGATSKFTVSGAGGLDGNKWGIEFGPDGNLYVTSFYTDEVLRYNGTTGDFIDVFVASNSGTLNGPSDLTFGPDGHLYVSGEHTDNIVKYNGSTGAFMSTFVTTQSGGLQEPVHLQFGPDGFLYVSSQNMSKGVLKYNGTTGGVVGNFAYTNSPEGILFAPVPGCTQPCYSDITISNVSVSSCIDHPLRDVATVTMDIAWNNPPSNEELQVIVGGKTEIIDVPNGATSPINITFNVIADGSNTNLISAIWETTLGCEATAAYDSPSPCSNTEIGCDILYLCGLDKPYDGDPWDHGWIEYLAAVNGSNTILPILTKDEAGLGTYDVMNQNTFVNVDFSAYEIIIVSATTEGHISSDLVDSLKNLPNSILLGNYELIEEFGLSSGAGSVSWNQSAYTAASTFEPIYNYDNPNSWSGKLFTKGNYNAQAIASLWSSEYGIANTDDGIIYKNKASDVLTGVSSGHGNRVYLGYHFNGIYANSDNNGYLPSPVSSWFTPENHLTLKGKELFDKALVYLATDCIDEICDDGIDNDEDGLTDCADPECMIGDLDPGTISGDEIFCAPFASQEILSYEDPTSPDGTFTIKWQQSTDNVNWNDIAGENGLTYAPGNIAVTTYFRRVVTSDKCSSIFYSNVVGKVVDSSLPICIEDEEFEFPCEIGHKISPSGTGIKGVANPGVRVLNPTYMEYYIVEATFSGGVGATDQVIFSTLEGDQKVVNKQYFDGESGNSGNRYFRTILPPSDSIFLSYNGDVALAESFVVYTVATMDNFSSATKGYESFGKSVHKELLAGEEYVVSFPLTPTINHKEVFANISLSSIVNDGTEIYVSVYGGGVSKTDTITEPNKGNTLDILFSNIEELDPNTDSLYIKIQSPSSNGQTALISGYLAALVECDQNLVVTAGTDADCVKVGDTITYNYTLYNYADVFFSNISGTSSLGGSIDFGSDTIPANTQFYASQDIVITQDMIDNPPLVNNVFVSGWNFTAFGIKPKSDGIIDTLEICEICEDGIDNDGDGLTDCLDPDCDGDAEELNPEQVICVGESVQLETSMPGGTWESNNTNIAIVSSDGIAVGVAEGSVTFTYTSPGGCVGITGILKVDDSVDVTIDFNGSLCLEDDSQLSGIVSGGTADYTYSWTGPNGFTGNAQTVDISDNGNYNLTVTDSKGCSSNTTAFVYEQYEPFIFTLNSEICEGESVTLSVNGANGGTYQWDANANNATSSSVTVIPGLPSTSYTVTVTNSLGCTTSATAVIDVMEKPAVNIIGPTEICVGETTQLTPTSGGIWTSSDYGVANVSNTGLVTGTGGGSVTFTFKDDVTGCYSDPTSNVTVTANTTPVISGEDQICLGDNPVLSSTIPGGTWSSSNTSIANIHSTTGVVSPVAQGSVTITYTPPSSGCYTSATYNINTYDDPVLNLNGPSEICEGTVTYVSASTSGTWTSSDESVAVVSNSGEITGVGAGTATFSFVSVVGCTEDLGTPITVVANPIISLTGPGDICVNETTTLSPTSGGVWISSNTSIATVTNGGVVTGKSAGNASFTFIESTYGCVSENNVTVTVSTPPNISAPSSNSLCIGETASITPTTGGVWTSSNSSIASITNGGIITANSAGSVTFEFTNNLTGCTSAASTPVTVQPTPTTNFTGPTSICQNESTSIEPNVGGYWSSTNVSIATINNQGIINGVSPGTVKFIFTNGNSGCVSDSSEVLTVVQPAVVDVSGPSNICVGETSTLTPNTGGTWTSSNTSVATVTDAGVVTGVSSGTATFIFENGSGCSSEATEEVVIEASPNVTYLGASSICIGELTTLSPSSGGTWTSSNTAIATITNEGVATAVAQGVVSFTYTNTTTGCSATTKSDLMVNAPPTINIVGDVEICIGESTNLQPSFGGSWISSNNSIASIMANGTVTGLSAGEVRFTFIESATGCSSEDSAPITILPRPNVTISGANTICAGSTTTLSPSTGGNWTSSNTAVATVTNGGVVTGVSQGLAKFTFTSTKGCASNETAPVIVFESPSVLIDGPSSLCVDETVQMLPSSGGTWTSSNPSIASITNTGLVTALMPGTSTFTYTDSNTGCVSDPSELVTVDSNPSISLVGPAEICIGGTTNMNPSSGGIWTSLNPQIATIQNDGEIVGIGSGEAKFIFMSLTTGCTSDTSSAITVLPGPDISFNGPTELCLGDTTYLLPSSGGTWESTNPTIASISNSGMIIALNAGTAKFQFTETSTNCKSELSELLTVNGPPSVGVVGPSTLCLSATTNLSPSSGGTWESLNPTVASVDANGVVTGLSEGTAYFVFTDDITGCESDGNLSIDVQASPQIVITGSDEVCLGYTMALLPSISGIWTSSNPAIATISNSGVITARAPGVVTFQFMDPITGCSSQGASDPVTIVNCTNHDFNVTLKNELVFGDLNTNDKASNAVYGGVIETISKPLASLPMLTVNTDGTYSFKSNKAGKYIYRVPVCMPPVLEGCKGTLLEINVVENVFVYGSPISNLEYTTTYRGALSSDPGDMILIDALANDTCIYAGSCTIDKTSISLIGSPSNGSAMINGNYKIEYTPNPNFIGIDTIDYTVCLIDGITCSQSQEIIIVNHTSAMNSTVANDDFYYTMREAAVSGNVLQNDMDPERESIAALAAGSAVSPILITEGSYYITSDGDFYFTPADDFVGTVNIVYSICDDDAEPYCTDATIHILVLDDLSLNIRVYLEGAILYNEDAETQAGLPLMRDDLRVSPFTGKNYIPLSDPYSFDMDPFIDTENRFVKTGPGMLTKNQFITDSLSVFSVTGDNAIVDWVHVQMRSKADSTVVLGTRSGLLQRDGDIVDLDGTSRLRFQSINADSFYVVVKHRSHLGVMSQLVTNVDLIDFTDPDFPVYNFGTSYGNGFDYRDLSRKNDVVAGYSVLWAGDFDSNGKVKFTNPDDDQNVLFLGVLFSSPEFLINYDNAYGYFTSDFDMNSKSKYTNPKDDLNLLFSQILLYPLNTSFLSNFSSLIEQVPE